MLEEINDYCDKNSIISNQGYDFKTDLKKISTKKITGNNKYTIFIHKNQNNYRPISFINPVLYVFLARIITQEKNWQIIQERFKKLKQDSEISCHSLPQVDIDREKDLAPIIKPWLIEVERQSLINSLEYNFLFKTDISDCYPSIYTHSISWALHGKDEAKKNKNKSTFLGNQIDEIVRYISDNQTNGIPQGSGLMDFIAEIVLFYLDTKISAKVEKLDCKIIRWRDDYRVFAKNEDTLNLISKIFTQEFLEFNFMMNSGKTKIYSDIIIGSVKSAKIARITDSLIFPKICSYNNMLEFLIKLHVFATKNKEASSIAKFFNNNHRDKFKKIQIIEDEQIQALIAILVKILSENLKYFPKILTIIFDLLSKIQNSETKRDIILQIKDKFDSLLYIEYLEIWLQRVTSEVNDIKYKSGLIKLLVNNESNWWEVMFKNDDWLKKQIKEIVKKVTIIDQDKFNNREPRIDKNELSDFMQGYSSP